MSDPKPTMHDQRLYSEGDYRPLWDALDRLRMEKLSEADIESMIADLSLKIAEADVVTDWRARRETLHRELAARHREDVAANFNLSSDHLKLIAKMRFDGMWYGDIVSIGVSGKRPFGTSSCLISEVAEICGWEYDIDYDPSAELQQRVSRILDELPLAIACVIRKGMEAVRDQS